MNAHDVSILFSALDHPTRVEVLMALLNTPKSGIPMGELSDALGIPASTLKHHLLEMEQAGIVCRIQEGRKSLLSVDTAKLDNVVELMRRICCPSACPLD